MDFDRHAITFPNQHKQIMHFALAAIAFPISGRTNGNLYDFSMFRVIDWRTRHAATEGDTIVAERSVYMRVQSALSPLRRTCRYISVS